MKNNKLAVVVPCYNEQEVLEETTKRLISLFDTLVEKKQISEDSFILYVNDGSRDRTWEIITKLHENTYVNGLNLAGNVGHQNALMAGLTTAVENSDMIVTIDADLQDDVNAIGEMVSVFHDGNDIVYGVRSSRDTDTWFKRTTAEGFYSLMKNLGVKSVYNHADFRLMSKRAVKALLAYNERNLFIRGIVPLIGYKTTNVYYKRSERFAGESKYPLTKMLTFAFDGITSFSVKPVHFVLYLGVLFLLVALGIFVWVVAMYAKHNVVPGWSSIMISVWFCSGCVLTGLGIVGEYIGKIYIEVKQRPRFNVEHILMH